MTGLTATVLTTGIHARVSSDKHHRAFAMLCLMDASSSREIPLTPTSTTELFNVLLLPEEDVTTNERGEDIRMKNGKKNDKNDEEDGNGNDATPAILVPFFVLSSYRQP